LASRCVTLPVAAAVCWARSSRTVRSNPAWFARAGCRNLVARPDARTTAFNVSPGIGWTGDHTAIKPLEPTVTFALANLRVAFAISAARLSVRPFHTFALFESAKTTTAAAARITLIANADAF